MLKKVFPITMLGEPFPWIREFIDDVQFLGQYGWGWKIFTPANITSKGNVEIVPLDASGLNDLIEKKLGVRSQFGIHDGHPTVHVTDIYMASGRIFEDWLKGADFWGVTNLDVVYGRLDVFYPDSFLERLDVFTDDVDAVNGVFSLWRNSEQVNSLYKEIPEWQKKWGQGPCPKCSGSGDRHFLYGTDEYDMTNVLKRPDIRSRVRYAFPQFYPAHSHDRLENHIPEPKLARQQDGSLWELLKDVNGPQWEHARPFIGRSIPYFHFPKTKKWPSISRPVAYASDVQTGPNP